jgi:hypothetical protein
MPSHSIRPTATARLSYRLEALPSRAPAPRPRGVHDRTFVVRREPERTALPVSDEAFAAGLLLASGLLSILGHLWFAPVLLLA